VKALCLGAHAVGVGRLQGIGLAAGGETALTRILEIIETEMVSCMGLLGAKNLAELGPHLLAKADPLPHRNWIESAFPLLSEGYGRMDVGGLCLRLPGER
jgi:isopentenyl diphosphate isomerase/L-lactate dehydrogenase-like FMN-dependent dehydrogenase